MSSPAPRQEAEVCKIKGLRGHPFRLFPPTGLGVRPFLSRAQVRLHCAEERERP